MADLTRIPMTPEGHQALKEELRHLKSVERPKNVQDIEEALAQGDLSENAEYHAAKERQGFIEGRSREIETKLSRAEVINVSQLSGSKVRFGATVTLYDVDTEEEVVYKIVGEDESDIASGKVSITSPIARAMIGREEDDEVKVRTPKGVRTMEIVSVEYR